MYRQTLKADGSKFPGDAGFTDALADHARTRSKKSSRTSSLQRKSWRRSRRLGSLLLAQEPTLILSSIEADMEAEYRSKMETLENAQREAENKLARQKSDFEHRLKVRLGF